MFAPLAVFGSLGWTEILLILFIALLLFGGKRLPSLAKDLGDGIRSFRKSLTGESDDSSQQISQEQERSVPKEETKTSKSKKSKLLDKTHSGEWLERKIKNLPYPEESVPKRQGKIYDLRRSFGRTPDGSYQIPHCSNCHHGNFLMFWRRNSQNSYTTL